MKKSVTIKIVFLTFFIYLIPISLFSSADSNEKGKLEQHIYESFYSGDYHRIFESIENFLNKYPFEPVSVQYYSDLIQLADVFGYERIETIFRKRLLDLEKSNPGNKNQLYLLLNLKLENLLYHINPQKAKDVSKRLNPLRKWSIVGPYKKYGDMDIDHPFLPEIISDHSTLREKKRNFYAKNGRGNVNIKKLLYPGNGIAYAITSFNLKGPVKIRIYSNSKYKLIVNGKTCINNYNRDFSNIRIVKIWGTDRITLMLKLMSSPSWNFRVILTDENDRIIKHKLHTRKLYLKDFRFREEMEYPYNVFMKQAGKNDSPKNRVSEKARAYKNLGIYFDELGSYKSIQHFKNSLSLKYSIITEYSLSSAMIDLNDNKSSAVNIEGWRIINELSRKNIDFVPARYKKFRRLINNRDFLRAYKDGRELILKSPNHFLLYFSFLDLLDYLGYENEFKEYLFEFKNRFPYSIYPLISEARFYKNKDIEKYINICNDILKKKTSYSTINKLISIYESRGEYERAIKLIGKYNYNDALTDRYVDNLINIKNYELAKKLIFNKIILNETPYSYYRLGKIDFLDNSDPMMYWQKMISLNPSLHNLSDYVKYLGSQKMLNPFQKYIGKSYLNKKITKEIISDNIKSSHIKFKGRIFLLQKDGSSRIFCEDLIVIKDQKGIGKWGEYKVPYQGKLLPVRIRVYQKDGTFSNSYRINKIDSNNYVSLSSLKKDSIIHISYIVNNPISIQGNSKFFYIPYSHIQNYDEAVENFSIKIISPEEIDVNFSFKNKDKISIYKIGDKKVYSLELRGLGKIYREDFSGSSLNSLPYFSFSTMKNLDDFRIWYDGLLMGKDEFLSFDPIKMIYPKADLKSIKEKNVSDIIEKVYGYISREINLQKNLLYYPELAENIMYNKKGTTEDKVILAKAILKKLNIKSYIVFTRKKYMPKNKMYISPAAFSNILLYVPVDIKKSIWLDFSSEYFKCGEVNPAIKGTNSVILLKNGVIRKKINLKGIHGKHTKYEITILDGGEAKFKINSSYTGIYGSIRRHFKYKLYNEDVLYLLFSKIMPTLDIRKYIIKNELDNRYPFEINLEGSGLGLFIAGVDKLIVQPILNKCDVYKYIRYPRRKQPLVITYPIVEDEKYIYNLPARYLNYEIKKKFLIKSKFGMFDIRIVKQRSSNIL
ncbi:tetratricopeptide repeat protein, partial [Spirochaetota bacterium]